MKVCSLYGASASYDNGMGTVMKIICSTLIELGVEIEEINLIERNIPYFMGMKTEPVRIITESIKRSDSVIFATPSQLFSPSAVMKCLLDYFEMDEYKDLLKDKNCMIVTIANKYGERDAADYISRIIDLLGGKEASRIAFGGNNRASIGQSALTQEIIEKQVEDYYRIVRQNKKYFNYSESEFFNGNTGNMNSHSMTNAVEKVENPPNKFTLNSQQISDVQNENINTINSKSQINSMSYDNLLQTPPPQNKMPQAVTNEKSIFSEINDILGNLSTTNPQLSASTQNLNSEYTSNDNKKELVHKPFNFDSFTARQEEDIKEISKLFSQKAQKIENSLPINENVTYSQDFVNYVAPRTKTVKQQTFSLPHYFQPQLAADINAVIQINITGAEMFECYLSIRRNDCQCIEGVYLSPDLTILSNASVWYELLKGKFSAQKAFMTGQLKVRGDFLLLNKFDQLFKKM